MVSERSVFFYKFSQCVWAQFEDVSVILVAVVGLKDWEQAQSQWFYANRSELQNFLAMMSDIDQVQPGNEKDHFAAPLIKAEKVLWPDSVLHVEVTLKDGHKMVLFKPHTRTRSGVYQGRWVQ